MGDDERHLIHLRLCVPDTTADVPPGRECLPGEDHTVVPRDRIERGREDGRFGFRNLFVNLLRASTTSTA